jgi:hypothetical protein
VFVDQGQFVLAHLLEQQMLETSTSVVNSLSLNLDDALFFCLTNECEGLQVKFRCLPNDFVPS